MSSSRSLLLLRVFAAIPKSTINPISFLCLFVFFVANHLHSEFWILHPEFPPVTATWSRPKKKAPE